MMQILDHKDRLGSLLILAFSIVYMRYALVLPVDPLAGEVSFTARTLPVGLAAAAIAFSFLQLILSVRTGDEVRVSRAVKGYRWRPTVLLILAMSAYATLFGVLGFLLSSFLFLSAGFFILGERRWLLTVSIAGILVGFLWVLLTQVFGLHLDAGDIFRPLIPEPS
jgi:putative tricarboxylic transport membrane protein